MSPADTPPKSFPFLRRWLRRFFYLLAGLAGLVVIFYNFESYKGRSAWHRAQDEIEAKGEKLEWKDRLPAPVADSENMLKAPKMEEWFGGGINKGPVWFDLEGMAQESLRLYGPGPFILAEIELKTDDGRDFEDDGSAVIRWEDLPVDAVGNREPVLALRGVLFEQESALTLAKPSASAGRPVIIRTKTPPEEIRLSSSLLGESEIAEFSDAGRPNTSLLTAKAHSGSGLPLLSAADYLAFTKPLADSLDALKNAGERPHCQFQETAVNSWNMFTHFVGPDKAVKLGRVLRQRGLAHVFLNQPGPALDEDHLIGLCRRLVMARPSHVLSFQNDLALFQMRINLVGRGLEDGVWQESHLARWQESFASEDFLKSALESLRNERALDCASIDSLSWEILAASNSWIGRKAWWESEVGWFLALSPSGWRAHGKAHLALAYQRAFEFVRAGERRIEPALLESGMQNFRNEARGPLPRNLFGMPATTRLVPLLQKAARAQTTADLGVIICALERHRLAQGALPETLDALVPKYLAALPRQVVNGNAFHYRVGKDGGGTVWSEGWDLSDEDGKISVFDDLGKADDVDWGWRLPARKTR